jgi:hypothetical protein
MKQVYVRVVALLLAEFYHGTNFALDMRKLLGKNASKFFGQVFFEPQFPKDAKIVRIDYELPKDIYTFYIESQQYPDVLSAPEVQLICYRNKSWLEPEVVQFT